jgi:hypothetical protein
MRLSGVFDTIFAIFKRNVANYLHRRVREASKSGFSTFVWVTVGACARFWPTIVFQTHQKTASKTCVLTVLRFQV